MIAFPSGLRLVLASASPRRADLLRSVGLEFEVRPSDLDETIHEGESAADYVRRLSLEKAVAAGAAAGPTRSSPLNSPATAAEGDRVAEPATTGSRLGGDVRAAQPVGDVDVVPAADTTVEVDGRVLGKPADADEARRMLRALSGRRHRVHTGVTVAVQDRTSTILVTTAVEFAPIDDHTIDWYVDTGEPYDKAGGYAIQGGGGALVARVDGSVTNVVGLPLAETVHLLRGVAAGFRATS